MKLSIVTVVRNALPALRKTLEPFLASPNLEIEFVIVDGNSTDGTQDYVRALTLPNVRFLSEPDTGIYNAMNKGIRIAAGDYLYFLNAGDCITDLATFRRVLDQLGSADLFYANILFMTESGVKLRRYPNPIPMEFWFETHMCHQAVLFRRELFQKKGFYNEKYRFAADFDMIFRCWLDKGLSFRHIDEPIATYDLTGVSANPLNAIKVHREYAKIQRTALPLVTYLRNRYRDIPLPQNWILRKARALFRKVRFFFGSWPAGPFNFYFHPNVAQKKNLRVLHLTTYSSGGGAAIAALRLNKALNDLGVQSQVVSLYSEGPNPQVEVLRTVTGLRQIIERLKVFVESKLITSQRGLRRGQMSMAWAAGHDKAYLKKLIQDFDPHVIHLHWINHSFLTIQDIAELGRPIVWTFHDMWPFLGVKHYSSCASYKDGFESRVAGSKKRYDIDRITWLRKKKYWATMIPKTFAVCPSRWMAERASESSLWRDGKIVAIPNVIDCKEFAPVPRQTAKDILRIPSNAKRVLLFGAASPFFEGYKGFDRFLDILEKLTEGENRAETHVITFGSRYGMRMLNGITHRHFDALRSTEFLNVLYSAADVMTVASEMESFCLVAAEAQACGVPVVCFDTSGLKDVVDHLKTGYRAKMHDSADFVQGIRWVMDDPENYARLCLNARAKCEREFDAQVVANHHYEIYQEALDVGDKATQPPTTAPQKTKVPTYKSKAAAPRAVEELERQLSL